MPIGPADAPARRSATAARRTPPARRWLDRAPDGLLFAGARLLLVGLSFAFLLDARRQRVAELLARLRRRRPPRRAGAPTGQA